MWYSGALWQVTCPFGSCVPGPWGPILHPIERIEIRPKIPNFKFKAVIGQNMSSRLWERETCFVWKKEAYRCLVAWEPMTHLANDIWVQVVRSLAGLAHNTFLMMLYMLLLLLAGWMNGKGRPWRLHVDDKEGKIPSRLGTSMTLLPPPTLPLSQSGFSKEEMTFYCITLRFEGCLS